jgi:phosphomannomutase
VIERVKSEWQLTEAVVNTIDGVHIETEEWWVHLRKSNTEPIIRVIAEAPTEQRATEIASRFMSQLAS